MSGTAEDALVLDAAVDAAIGRVAAMRGQPTIPLSDLLVDGDSIADLLTISLFSKEVREANVFCGVKNQIDANMKTDLKTTVAALANTPFEAL